MERTKAGCQTPSENDASPRQGSIRQRPREGAIQSPGLGRTSKVPGCLR